MYIYMERRRQTKETETYQKKGVKPGRIVLYLQTNACVCKGHVYCE